MSKQKLPDIDEIIDKKWIVEFNRKPLDKQSLFGFILACNDDFTLIQEFDRSLFITDGYRVFRNNSVKGYKVYNDKNYFLNEVIYFKKIKPKPLTGISIENWTEILQTANKKFRLLVIEREKVNNKICNIGKLETVKKKSFTLKEIDADAVWIESFKYKFDDLTKVGFGGHYENTLSLVAGKRENP